MRRINQTVLVGSEFSDSIRIDVLDLEDSDSEECDWNDAFHDLLSYERSVDKDHRDICIGFAILFANPKPTTCYIEYIAFSNSNRVVIVKRTHDIDATETKKSAVGSERTKILASFLGGEFLEDFTYTLVGFEMGSLALALHRELQLPLRAIDLSGLLGKSCGDLPVYLIREVIPESSLNEQDLEAVWKRPPEQSETETEQAREDLKGDRVALRAWIASAIAGTLASSTIENADILDTRIPDVNHVNVLAEIQSRFDLLQASTPERIVVEFSTVGASGPGQVTIKQESFKDRIRKGKAQNVRLLAGETVHFEGRATKVKGKGVIVSTPSAADLPPPDPEFEGPQIDRIEVLGRGDLTVAEVSRVRLILDVLQGKKLLSSSEFVRKIWFPTEEDLENMHAVQKDAEEMAGDSDADTVGGIGLNPSQATVARVMLSDCNFALVHGPPGTGKTRTIAAVVKAWAAEDKHVYLAAQSNVGVKNIAETLAKQGFKDFKLIVSADFYFEWHEHIYDECRDQMISSSEFTARGVNFQKLFGGIKVVLSTVTMLFHPALERALFDLVPMRRLILDEASQIYVGDQLALLHKFSELEKVCWFGDPKQLPPHQGETIPGLDSVYDIPHIKAASLLLNTQYRMPAPIGTFISNSMYEGKLSSCHKIESRDCVRFVDVSIGEEVAVDKSWINREEVATVVHLVVNYYSPLNYCVITPYDPQRKAIESALKNAGLSINSKCFTVDSFQGNEADYIIISTVRTTKTGFLDLHNRVNVMLTRCKAGMVVVTQRGFIRNLARMTLVGKLADEWVTRGRKKGVPHKDNSGLWVYYTSVKEGTADLPGARGHVDSEELLMEPPQPAPRVSPSGFNTTPRDGKPPLAMFNGLTSPQSSERDGPGTRRKGKFTFVGNEPRPVASHKPPGPAAPTSAWNIPRPAIQISSKPVSGAWGSGSVSIKSPTPQRPSLPRVMVGPSSEDTTKSSEGRATTVRIGAPMPRLGSTTSAGVNKGRTLGSK